MWGSNETRNNKTILLTRNEIAMYFANTTHAIALQQDNSPTATCILDSMKTRQSLWGTLFVALFPGHVGRLGLKVHVARLRSATTPHSEALSHRGKSLGTRLGLRVMALQEKAKPTNSCYPAVGDSNCTRDSSCLTIHSIVCVHSVRTKEVAFVYRAIDN